jgi:hypothetical protein
MMCRSQLAAFLHIQMPNKNAGNATPVPSDLYGVGNPDDGTEAIDVPAELTLRL